jgi:hypothetical protein
MKRSALYIILLLCTTAALSACRREPPLHLYDEMEIQTDFPVVDVNLDVYWDYELNFGVEYNWKEEWYYGWDEKDRQIFGELGYAEPTAFNVRRYYTGEVPYKPHTSVVATTIEGKRFRDRYKWGFWDILVWNEIRTLDGVQSLIFDETTTLDSVVAYTNQSMHNSRYQAPVYTRSFYEPEPLFTGYEQAIDINRSLEGFVYDPEEDIYVKKLNMILEPITYIYLTQVIIHHNYGRVTATDGNSNLSGFARTTTLNSGRAGSDAITVYYGTRLKKDVPYVPYSVMSVNPDAATGAERVDIVGGRLMTFGICNQNANRIKRKEDVKDIHRHYMDVVMQFNNGMDSTFVFDVTEQVRHRYRGGVITVELDMDTIPIPSRTGGSGFDAVVVEPDSVTHIIDM